MQDDHGEGMSKHLSSNLSNSGSNVSVTRGLGPKFL